MSNSLNIFVRGAALLAFVVAMPLCALPVVGKWYDAWLLGEATSMATKGKQDPPVELNEASVPQIEEPSPPSGEPGSNDLPRHSAASAESVDQRDLQVDARPNSLATDSASVEHRLEAIQARLQELDAEYLRLETIDAPRDKYRFECRVALAGNSAYSRPFEARGASPVEAMQLVLDEVETWRAARRPIREDQSGSRQR